MAFTSMTTIDGRIRPSLSSPSNINVLYCRATGASRRQPQRVTQRLFTEPADLLEGRITPRGLHAISLTSLTHAHTMPRIMLMPRLGVRVTAQAVPSMA